MSRDASKPIPIPKGVEIKLEQELISVKGPKGALTFRLHPMVELKQESDVLRVKAKVSAMEAKMCSGTARAVVSNMITGVTKGFEKKLLIKGTGFRAAVQGKILNLSLGFSHPVNYKIPEGITIETPSQTDIVVRGADRQKVGQVAADIRAYRPPEPYKGKGVRYSDERVIQKEAKKK